MQFSDEGYIINLRRHGENSLIVTVLSAQHGKLAGYVKGGMNKKKFGVFQLGNAITFNAYSRLEENMPQFRGIELSKAHAVSFMENEAKLAVLGVFCQLLNTCVAEKENLEFLWLYICDFMNSISTPSWLVKYAFLEYYLLEFLGIGLDLSECAATGRKDNLAFVSPKSGKAVCYEAGLPYAEKMFKFPACIVDKNYALTSSEVSDLLELTAFFLNKNFFRQHGLKFPNNRGNLLHILNLTENKV